MYYSKRNNEELDKLNPIVKSKMQIIMQEAEAQGLDVLITDSLRTNTEQTKLYNQGRTTKGKVVTNAKAGQSLHNYGLAFDIVPVKSGQLLYGDYETYKKFAIIAKKHGFTWGDDWQFKDTPHFEYTQGNDWQYFAKGGQLAEIKKQEKTYYEKFNDWLVLNKIVMNGNFTEQEIRIIIACNRIFTRKDLTPFPL